MSQELPPFASPEPDETPAVEPLQPATTAEPAPRRRRGIVPSRIAVFMIAVLAGTGLFAGGYSLGTHVASTPGTPAAEEARFGSFWDVYSLIQNEYAGSPRPSQNLLVQGAIKGMLESLNDQWSYYQAPDDFTNSLQSVGGQAQGIGVHVQLQPVDPASNQACKAIGNGCELAVVKPIAGSPAEAAGVKAGDVFSSVDGQSLDGKTVDDATALIKGKVGTKVTILFLRDGQPLSVTITRAVFDEVEVEYQSIANGEVAYFAVNGVNPVAATQFHAALKEAMSAGQTNVILDLRGNLGGYVESAEKILDEFLSSGVLVYQQDATGTTSELVAHPGGLATDPSIKVVVLVDGNTASAAEIIAGALQSRGRAVLLGTKTYGKGVVQAWLPLPDNFGGIHLTVGRWLTPDKVWIQGKGLKPDIPVDTANARAGTDPVLDAGLTKLGFTPTATESPTPSQSPTESPAPSGSPAASSPSPGPSGTPAAAPAATPAASAS